MARRISSAGLTAADFTRIALSLDGAEQGAHMGAVDFRVGGRIFATLASQAQGYGNLMLRPEHQSAFVEELPEVFVPIAGGWGRMGMTHIVLAKANEDMVRGALQTAWQLRKDTNARVRTRAVKTAKAARAAASPSRASSATAASTRSKRKTAATKKR